MSEYNEAARAKAIEYLRNRGLYLLDGKFTPTQPSATDVAETIRRFRRTMEKQMPKLKVAK